MIHIKDIISIDFYFEKQKAMRYFRVSFTITTDSKLPDDYDSDCDDVCPLIGVDTFVSMSIPIGKSVPYGIIDDFKSSVDKGLFVVTAPMLWCRCFDHEEVFNVVVNDVTISDDDKTNITYKKHSGSSDSDSHSDNENDGDDNDKKLDLIKNALALDSLRVGTKMKYNSHWNCECQNDSFDVCGCGCQEKHDGWTSKNDAGFVDIV